MQQSLSHPINKQIDSSGDSLSEPRKRKLSIPCSLDFKEARMTTNKRRKREISCLDDKITYRDNGFSNGVDLPDISIPSTDNDDVFEWMENLLGNGHGKRQTFTKGKIKISSPSCNDVSVDSLLTLNESDPCYEEMISLLAEDENNNNNEENMFKKIQESFINDRLPEHHSFSSQKSQSSFISLKKPALKKSPSFNTRVRSSRIGIRDGFDQLVKANRLTAKTRYMLLTCTPTFFNKDKGCNQ